MLNLELFAQGGNHSVIQVCTVVRDDPVGDTIPAYEVLFDEAGNHILCNGGEGSCFNPFGKVINGHQDETMSIGRCRLDLSNHVDSPHCERPRSCQNVERNWRNMYLVSIDLAFVTSTGMFMAISFHGRPVVAFP